VWRELPSSCRSRFLAAALPLFERYGQLSSAGDFNRCAAVLNLILDFPSQALIRRGHVRELQQALEQHVDRFYSLLAAATGDETKTAATDDPPINSQTEPSLPELEPLTQPQSPVQIDNAGDSDSDHEDDSCASTASTHSDIAAAVTAAESGIDSPASDDANVRMIRRVNNILREGAPRAQRRAFRSLNQAPLASITPSTVQQLRELHPVATERMCAVPANKGLEMAAVDQQTLFALLKRRVNNGSAPGPSGWTGSHLQLIADSESNDAKSGLCLLIRDICNGVFGGATQQRLLASVLMPIGKKDGRSVRPIAMGEVLVKLAAHYCMSLIEGQLPTLFPRIQFGVKRAGGSEAAAQLTRALFDQSRRLFGSTIALKTDFANAFNAASRARIWDTLLKHPETEPLWRMFHWAYSDPSALLLYDRSRLHTRFDSSEGVRQGDPFAAFAFALSVQSLYESAIAGMPDCHAVSVQDDLTLIGPAEQVFAAYDRIVAAAPSYHLSLRVEKCAVYVPDSLSDELTRAEVLDGCITRQLSHSASLESLGVMLGSDGDIRAHCAKQVAELEQRFRLLRHPAMPVQAAFLLLRSCALPSLSFLTRTTPPELLRDSAQRFDKLVRDTFLHIMQLDVVRIDKSQVATADELRTMLSLPLKLGGMGLRPAERVAPSAYFASAAAILPDFLRAFPSLTDRSSYSETELHQQLEECRSLMEQQGIAQGGPSPAAAAARAAAPNSARRGRGPKVPTPASMKKAAAAVSASVADAARSAARTASAAVSTSLLNGSVDSLWSAAASFNSSKRAASGGFLQTDHLQRSATELMESELLSQLREQSSVRRRTLLVANATPHSCEFLTVLPTQPLYCISNASLRLAVRHRLGVLPYDSLSDQRCYCTTKTPFALDPDHFHSCAKHRRTLLTQRHNNLVQVLQDLAVSVGFSAIREPNSHVRPETIAAQASGSEEYNHHADLLLLKHGLKLYIDVTVTRPTKESVLKMSKRAGASTTPLFATRTAAAMKHYKYDEIARVNEYRMVPFAVETYGGIGAEATTLLYTMAAHCKEYSPREFLLHAHRRISVALQSSNADIAQLAMQQHHLRQHAANQASFDHNQRVRDAHLRIYAQPADGDQLARHVSIAVTTADVHAREREEELLSQPSDSCRLSFVHERRVGFADISRSIDAAGIISSTD